MRKYFSAAAAFGIAVGVVLLLALDARAQGRGGRRGFGPRGGNDLVNLVALREVREELSTDDEQDDLLGIVALESHRHRCMVIGEDLGTVADSFREKLARARVLSYRLLLFEREGEGFKPASAYPRQALVSWSTHDLPTLAGWWKDDDLRLIGKDFDRLSSGD